MQRGALGLATGALGWGRLNAGNAGALPCSGQAFRSVTVTCPRARSYTCQSDTSPRWPVDRGPAPAHCPSPRPASAGNGPEGAAGGRGPASRGQQGPEGAEFATLATLASGLSAGAATGCKWLSGERLSGEGVSPRCGSGDRGTTPPRSTEPRYMSTGGPAARCAP